MSLYYLGSFPPPRGGVTIKNENLLYALQGLPQTAAITPVDFSKLKKGDFHVLRQLAKALTAKDSTYIVGVAGRKYRKWTIKWLDRINRPAMERSILILMGGLAAQDIVEDPKVRKCAAHFKKIYCETESMVKTLQEAGLSAGYYPNGRFRPLASESQLPAAESQRSASESQRSASESRPSAPESLLSYTEVHHPESDFPSSPLHIVYFSLISQPKGAGRTLQAASCLPDLQFTFFGPIAPDYKEEFLKQADALSNVSYQGIFQGSSEEIYRKLSEFDLVVLPTACKTEGVPGILVEAKIAGIAEVVSDVAFNSEIVEDGVSGIVLKDNTPEQLKEALLTLDRNRELLLSMKRESRKSAEKYYIENYIAEIADTVSTI